jgi:hypothetical protein
MFEATGCLRVKYETALIAMDFYAAPLTGSRMNSRITVVA